MTLLPEHVTGTGMSNRCPHCGAASGKFHEPCPYAPGGKKSKAPRPEPKVKPLGTVRAQIPTEGPRPTSRPQLTAEEVKAVSAKALEQAPAKAEEPPASEPPADGKRKGPVSHPDCEMCAANREKARLKMQRLRKGAKE